MEATMRIQTIVRKLGLVCLCCGLGFATVYAVEDEAKENPQETMKGTDDATSELPEVFADEEKVIPCDENDEREACVEQRTGIRSRGLNVPPQIPFKIVSARFGRCLRPTSRDDGAEVKLASCETYSSRYWTPSNVFDAPDWIQLRNNWSGKCLKRSGDKLIQFNCVNGYVTWEAIRQAHRDLQYWEFSRIVSTDHRNDHLGERISDASISRHCIRAASSTGVQALRPCSDGSYWRWQRNPM